MSRKLPTALRRSAVPMTAILSSVLFLTACGGDTESGGNAQQGGGAKSGEVTKLSAPSQPNETGFPMWLAQKRGYFKKNNLDVTIEYLPTGAAALAGGAAGDWQAGWLGGPPALSGYDKFGLISVGPEITEPRNLILFMRADALKGKTPADVLRTEQVAVNPNSTLSLTLYACARHLGVDDKELKVVNLDPPAIIQALQAGRVAAGVGFSSPDWPLVSKPKEYVQVCDAGNGGLQLVDPYVVTKRFYEENPEATAAFIDAVYAAQEWAREKPPELTDLLLEYAQEVGIEATPESAEYAFSVRNWYSLDEAVTAMEDGTVEKDFKALSDYLVSVGAFQEPVDVETMVPTGLEVIKEAQEYRQQKK